MKKINQFLSFLEKDAKESEDAPPFIVSIA